MLVSLTVGKVDAGMAVLLTEDKRIIEFPSILLPPDITTGSIVDITVSRNHATESSQQHSFNSLQSRILQTFGLRAPTAPVLRVLNTTQTSVVLEWDALDLATASLRSLSLFRNGSKVGTIPRPLETTTTKISGLAVDTEYRFQLVLRTSAGTHASEILAVRTHAMTDLTGITVTPGIMPAPLRDSLVDTVQRIGARIVEGVPRIDTTHFVCTEARGVPWEKAREMNIPVVVPDWVKGCEREGRIVGVRQYYLDADPRLRNIGPSAASGGTSSAVPAAAPRGDGSGTPPPGTPVTKITPPTPERGEFQGHGRETAGDERARASTSSSHPRQQVLPHRTSNVGSNKDTPLSPPPPQPPAKDDDESEVGEGPEEKRNRGRQSDDGDESEADRGEETSNAAAAARTNQQRPVPQARVEDADDDEEHVSQQGDGEASFENVAL